MSTITTNLIHPIVKLRLPVNRPSFMAAVLVCSDLAALTLAGAIGLTVKVVAIHGQLDLTSYLRLWPFLLVFPFVFSLEGLYSGVALSPPEELRRATISSAVIFLFLAGITVSFRGAQTLFTWLLFMIMILSVTFIPIFRAIIRRRLASRSWWGYPAIVFGAGEPARRAIRTMQAEPWLGLKPVAVIDDCTNEPFIEGVPVMRPAEFDDDVVHDFGRFYGVQALSGQLPDDLRAMIERHSDAFSHLLVIPDMPGFSTLWVNPRSFGGILSLETHKQVLARRKRLTKRAMDIAITSVGVLVALPFIAAILAWIRLDSPGPVFFGHPRIGRGGRIFRAWKFRSMVTNGDEVLAAYLLAHPESRAEWEENHKLRDDPRVTRAGKFLRSTSLDELPQLWNVICGEMSLVGPRPIVKAEVSRYGSYFDVYTKVEGGVTGLWQVSGRSDTTYAERVTLDTFYVRNWSVWLDLCILFQTIGVVFARRGAY